MSTSNQGEATRQVSGLAAGLARFLLELFFRRIAVVGRERGSIDGPVVFVANHFNSLIDPAMLLAYLERRPRFLAKSTLWKEPIVWPLLQLAAAIPVYRRRDPGVDTSKNTETFARCHEALEAGGAIAIFPEGTSHSEPGLVPIKTGVSRIVLEAEARFGGVGTRIVPAGLVFDHKTRFRSSALMVLGEPIDPSPEVARYADDPREAVRALTDRVGEALADVTLGFPSWEEARLIDRAVDIYGQPTTALPRPLSLEETFAATHAFVDGYRVLKERHPEPVRELSKAICDYDDRLAKLRLRDEQVAAEYPAAGLWRFAAKSVVSQTLRLPVALLGTVLNVIPFEFCGWLARRKAETPDVLATYKILASMMFYPLFWGMVGLITGAFWGPLAGFAMALVTPLSGYVALKFHERRNYFFGHLRAFLLLRSHRTQIDELRSLRREVLDGIQRLIELYGSLGES